MLDEVTFNKIIDNFVENNKESIAVTEQERIDGYRVYKRLMNETSNKDKSYIQQVAMVEDMYVALNSDVRGYRKETWEHIFNDYSDNKHLNYFDTFLDNGERDKIIRALEKHKLPTAILKGIRKNQPFENTTDGVTVEQIMGTTDTGTPQVDGFLISIREKGEKVVIYEFKRERDFIYIVKTDEQTEMFIQDMYDRTDELKENQRTRFRQKVETQNGITYEDYSVTQKENVVKTIHGYKVCKDGKTRFVIIKRSII